MTISVRNLVKHTAGGGTADFTLVDVTGYNSLNSGDNTLTFAYSARGVSDPSKWECGQGVYTHSTRVLARTTITESSNSGSKVDFGSDTTSIVIGASRALFESFGVGTVTSVGLSLPAIFTVTVPTVTSSGTLTATLAAQPANRVLAGPASGADATPTVRALVAADVPDLSSVYDLAGAASAALVSALSAKKYPNAATMSCHQ
jgi:hypothetical protein